MKLKIDICCVIEITDTTGLYSFEQIADNIRNDEMLREDISSGQKILSYDVTVAEETND